MSKQERKALRSLSTGIRHNMARVEKRLAQSGTKPDMPVVYSAAKYYNTLKRLAEE